MANVKVLPTMATAEYFRAKQRNRIIILALLAACLLAVGIKFSSFVTAKAQPLPLATDPATKKGTIDPPGFLFVITGGPNDLALKKPLDVAVAPNGDVYVTSNTAKYNQGRVEVFSGTGDYKFSFSDIKGGTLQAPVSLAVNKAGQVYVADIRAKAVYVFSAAGKYLSTFRPDIGQDGKWNPVGLTFDGQDNLYVTDIYAEHQVLVFGPNGQLKFKFGGTASVSQKGQYPGKFFFPNDVAVDSQGYIYVADSNNRRVEVFSAAGKYMYTIETAGLPRGIFVDKKDRLYVVDALGHDVSVYKKTAKEGPALTIFGAQGVEFGQLLYPNGLTLDASQNRIYVTNRENNRVEVFGWPVAAAAVAPVATAVSVVPLIIPSSLFVAWLFVRRRRYFVDHRFMDNVVKHKHLRDLAKKRGKIFVEQSVYDRFKDYREGDLIAGEVLHPISVEPALVGTMGQAHGLDHEAATLFAKASRGWIKPRILSEAVKAHETAGQLNMESMDHALFAEFYGLDTSTKN